MCYDFYLMDVSYYWHKYKPNVKYTFRDINKHYRLQLVTFIRQKVFTK